MGNPETKAILGYDIVQRQSNERQLKDEHGPPRKTGLIQVLANVGDNGCFTIFFLEFVCLIFGFKHYINYEINKIKNARILYA